VTGQLHAPAALHPGKSPRYLFDRRLGGPRSRSERCGVEKNLLPLPGIEPRPSSPNAGWAFGEHGNEFRKTIKISVVCDVIPYSVVDITDFLEENAASIFRAQV
jgi:hypothetical protein